jgi:hypothetical protein
LLLVGCFTKEYNQWIKEQKNLSLHLDGMKKKKEYELAMKDNVAKKTKLPLENN